MALADDIKIQVDTWVAANDETSLLAFRELITRWVSIAAEEARATELAELTALRATCKTDLDTLIAG